MIVDSHDREVLYRALGVQRLFNLQDAIQIPVMVRLLPDQAARLDKWRKALADNPGRPEAIRRLLEQSLPGHTRSHDHSAVHKASELAAKAIEGLADNRPASEHRGPSGG
jgi:hypothetical protein